MTQLRKCRDSISNYFDRVLEGVGHRGSSFTDLDAVTHDMSTGRVLIQEMKQYGEPINEGQRRTLEHLSTLPKFTVWVVVKGPRDIIGWREYRTKRAKWMTENEYRDRFQAWWNNVEYAPVTQVPPDPVHELALPASSQLHADDITW